NLEMGDDKEVEIQIKSITSLSKPSRWHNKTLTTPIKVNHYQTLLNE
ncbi:6257_t:CDS:2, partial [Acaulospora morrowiae]